MMHLLEYMEPTSLAWVFGLSTVLAIAMGFATGANDVANTFGTSVGSGALTLRKALVAAGIFEMLGALALGSHVAGTLKAGIANYACFAAEPSLYMIGMMSALFAAAAWLIFASLAGLPVSTTHSIVGGIVGMAWVLKGSNCVNWGMTGVGKIVLSWITSPLLSGFAAFCVFSLVTRLVLSARDPVKHALWSTPILLSGAVLFLEMLTFWDMVKPWWGKLILFLGSFILVFVLTAFVGIPILRKMINKYYMTAEGAQHTSSMALGRPGRSGSGSKLLPGVDSDLSASNDSIFAPATNSNGISVEHKATSSVSNGTDHETNQDSEQATLDLDQDTSSVPSALSNGHNGSINSLNGSIGTTDSSQTSEFHVQKAKQVFWYLQNFTACFGAFAHGANDTANAIGPFAAIFHLWKDGSFSPTEPVPFWIVALGGASIVLGLAILGYRVIQTMGKDLIHIDYASGFSSELSSSMTVVIASRLQIPVSSTHCQVGAIIGVGVVEDPHKQVPKADEESALAGPPEPETGHPTWIKIKRSLRQVSWKAVGKIFISWLVTVPVSAGISALLAYALRNTVVGPDSPMAPSNMTEPLATPFAPFAAPAASPFGGPI